MSIVPGLIEGVDHAGLPSKQEDWPVLRAYYESLGLTVLEVEITDPGYDYIGQGRRLQVVRNGQLIISFFLGHHPPHVALRMKPPGLQEALEHESFCGHTHWGHGNTSVFHDDPVGNKIELVTTNPDFHRDRD